MHRTLAALAALVLALGVVTIATSPSDADTESPTISGRVVAPDGTPVEGIAVWALYRYTTTGQIYPLASRSSTQGAVGPGTFHFDFPHATVEYMSHVIIAVGVNAQVGQEFTPNSASARWAPTYYPDAASPGDAVAPGITAENPDTALPDITLPYGGGTIRGKLTDRAGRPITGVAVNAYDDSHHSIKSVTSGVDGTYEVPASAGSNRVFFYDPDFVGEWYANQTTFGKATKLTGVPRTTRSGINAKLELHPMTLLTEPRISGHAKSGRTLTVTGGTWNPTPTKQTIQWFSRTTGAWHAIKGATRTTYRIPGGSYGRRFRAAVTASNPSRVPKTATSESRTVEKRSSSVSLSASSPSKMHVKVSATVKVSGAKATGSIRLACGGPYVDLAGKTVKLKNGKATTTLRLPHGSYTCRATYRGTSTISGSGKSKTVKVK